MTPLSEVKQRYQRALDSLTASLEQDFYVLAAVVYGSVARGEPWERSDIDIEIIMQDDLGWEHRYQWLVVDGINISASIVSRNRFKRLYEGALQGSFSHSIHAQSKLLFCKDESIKAWFTETDRIGERDQVYQRLRTAANVIPSLRKAEKWLQAKDDPDYCLVWLLYVVNSLAQVEVVLNGEAPDREVIHQALKYNPTFFNTLYTDLIQGPKTKERLEQALTLADGYFTERIECLFKPILDYLAEADSARSVFDLKAHFQKKTQIEIHLYTYEWLAEKGIIEKVTSPLRLTKKSRVDLETPAYFYSRDPGWRARPLSLANAETRYPAAVKALTAKLEQDRYVVAAILFGSLWRGDFWAKSDINLMILLRDDCRANRHFWFTEDGLNFDTYVSQRSQFKRNTERGLQGSMAHSVRAQSRLLFSKDDTLTAWYEEPDRIGDRDRPFQLLRLTAWVVPTLDKAEKWFYAKNDLLYCFVWIMYTVNSLARIEAVLNGEAPGREVIHQALKYNPTFFKQVYTDLIHGPKDRRAIQHALDLINGYLEDKADLLFQPVLDYLSAGEGLRTVTDLTTHFRKKVQTDELFWSFDWLARKGIIEKAALPVKLTRKSQVDLEAPAYFYDDDEMAAWE